MTRAIHDWFHKRERSSELMARVDALNRFFVAFEPHMQPNYVVRLKQEQSTSDAC